MRYATLRLSASRAAEPNLKKGHSRRTYNVGPIIILIRVAFTPRRSSGPTTPGESRPVAPSPHDGGAPRRTASPVVRRSRGHGVVADARDSRRI
ncbi:unnamed protein product [Euphydryas editha]|uniref:Uncharacterized protein n=1 Tax=Euphydryas editha TaxID=104508 RepID=A0AAU9VBN9_EUPED|nr:unnamed protein product [Euphydryas editha]